MPQWRGIGVPDGNEKRLIEVLDRMLDVLRRLEQREPHPPALFADLDGYTLQLLDMARRCLGMCGAEKPEPMNADLGTASDNVFDTLFTVEPSLKECNAVRGRRALSSLPNPDLNPIRRDVENLCECLGTAPIEEDDAIARPQTDYRTRVMRLGVRQHNSV